MRAIFCHDRDSEFFISERLERLDGRSGYMGVEAFFSLVFVHVKRVNESRCDTNVYVMGREEEGAWNICIYTRTCMIYDFLLY